MAYSRLSANPVGRLVLWVSGYRDERRALLSDKVCTALQLANFWQDVVEDWERGRRYIPADQMQRFGVTDEMIASEEVHAGVPRADAVSGRVCGRDAARGRPDCDEVDAELGRHAAALRAGRTGRARRHHRAGLRRAEAAAVGLEGHEDEAAGGCALRQGRHAVRSAGAAV
jgi:hypothetical protein